MIKGAMAWPPFKRAPHGDPCGGAQGFGIWGLFKRPGGLVPPTWGGLRGGPRGICRKMGPRGGRGGPEPRKTEFFEYSFGSPSGRNFISKL